MIVRSLITLILISVSSVVSAQRLDINLNQEAARVTYTGAVGGTTFGRTELSGGFLFNKDDNTLADLALSVIDMAGSKTPGLEIGLGPKFYYATVDEVDAGGSAIALGGNLRYKLRELNRIALYGTLYYAPGITSFLDAESLSEAEFRLAYEILPTADAYIGYRTIRMKVDNNDSDDTETIDSGAFLGMRFDF